MKQRDGLVDYIKGIAILLVVIGHFIEAFLLDGKDAALNHWLHNFIYSFHLPLFVFLSGFYIKSSFNQSFRDVIWKKTKSILWPSIAFWLVCSFEVCVGNAIYGKPILSGIESITSSYWFLKLIFVLYILTWIFNKVAKGNIYVHLLLALAFLLVGVNLQTYKVTYFYLFFILGYVCKTYFWPSLIKGKIVMFIMILGLYGILLYLFDWSKYVSNVIIGVVSIVPSSIHVENILPSIYLIALACAGIYCAVYLCDLLYKRLQYFNKTIIRWGGVFIANIYTPHSFAYTPDIKGCVKDEQCSYHHYLCNNRADRSNIFLGQNKQI